MTDRSESRQAGGQSGGATAGGAGPDINGQITGQIIGRHLLLIEDEANIAEAIRFILSRDGWDVRLHADGADAMAKLRAMRPDVVILDLMLPGGGRAWKFCRDARRSRSGADACLDADRSRARARPGGGGAGRGGDAVSRQALCQCRSRCLSARYGSGGGRLGRCGGASEDGAVQSTAVENRFVKDAS